MKTIPEMRGRSTAIISSEGLSYVGPSGAVRVTVEVGQNGDSLLVAHSNGVRDVLARGNGIDISLAFAELTRNAEGAGRGANMTRTAKAACFAIGFAVAATLGVGTVTAIQLLFESDEVAVAERGKVQSTMPMSTPGNFGQGAPSTEDLLGMLGTYGVTPPAHLVAPSGPGERSADASAPAAEAPSPRSLTDLAPAVKAIQSGETPPVLSSKPRFTTENLNPAPEPDAPAASTESDDRPDTVAEADPAETSVFDAQETVKAMEAVRDAVKNGEAVTPAMLAKLPEDMAQRIVDSGIAKGSNIVRLPKNVVDEYRGPDGIPTIPEADTWTAAGGNVTIPLPGGGDITSPDHIKEFGLEP